MLFRCLEPITNEKSSKSFYKNKILLYLKFIFNAADFFFLSKQFACYHGAKCKSMNFKNFLGQCTKLYYKTKNFIIHVLVSSLILMQLYIFFLLKTICSS